MKDMKEVWKQISTVWVIIPQDVDDYSSGDDDDYSSGDDDGLINENTGVPDMLDFEDDWIKGNTDDDDDWWT